MASKLLTHKWLLFRIKPLSTLSFSPVDLVWDFNEEHYKEFTRNYKNYSDSGHLSDAGALFLLKEIQEKILQAYAK